MEIPQAVRRAMEAAGVDVAQVADALENGQLEEEESEPEQLAFAPEEELPDPGRLSMGQWSDPARSGAPETQREAALSVYPTSGTARRRVLDFIASCGQDGATDEESERGLGMRHQSASARRYELHRDGWIEDSGARRMTTRGRQAVVWVLTEQARSQHVTDRGYGWEP